MTHPDDATLQTWHDRELAPDEAAAVAAHVARCAACEARATGLRALGDAMLGWADDVPGADLTAAILAKVSAAERANDVPASSAKVVPLDAARARRSPARAMLYPAFAAAAALVLFLVWRIPGGARLPTRQRPDPDPAAQTVAVGGGPGGAEVTQVDVQGAQSYSVLQIQGVSPGVMTAVVWIQDPPEDSLNPTTPH